MIIYDKDKMPERIWIHTQGGTWDAEKISSDDLAYVRADHYDALLDAAVSLEYWLREIVNNTALAPLNLLADAQPALDKWDRLCDGKE